jgi:hypothetical protein
MHVTGAVEEHVESRMDFYEVHHLLEARDIKCNRLNRLNILLKGIQSRHVNIRGKNICASARESNRRCSPDACPCRGDKTALSRQAATRKVLVYLRPRIFGSEPPFPARPLSKSGFIYEV